MKEAEVILSTVSIQNYFAFQRFPQPYKEYKNLLMTAITLIQAFTISFTVVPKKP